MKWKLRMYCDDGNGKKYWEDGVAEYDTYDKALISCYNSSLQEARDLMIDSDGDRWFETDTLFEITDSYHIRGILALGTIFPVVTLYYDKAPWDRENDCDIRIVTGYSIVAAEPDEEIKKYNLMLRRTHGENITVEIKKYVEDDDSVRFYFTTAAFGDTNDTWDTAEEAYKEADSYLRVIGEFW